MAEGGNWGCGRAGQQEGSLSKTQRRARTASTQTRLKHEALGNIRGDAGKKIRAGFWALG